MKYFFDASAVIALGDKIFDYDYMVSTGTLRELLFGYSTSMSAPDVCKRLYEQLDSDHIFDADPGARSEYKHSFQFDGEVYETDTIIDAFVYNVDVEPCVFVTTRVVLATIAKHVMQMNTALAQEFGVDVAATGLTQIEAPGAEKILLS